MTKFKALFCALLAAAALPQTAFAQTYVGVSGGLTLPGDSKNKGEFTGAVPATVAPNPVYPAIPAGTPLAWETEFDNGYSISGFIGHRFEGGLRVEGEVNYNRQGVKRHSGVTAGGANIDAVDASVLTRGATLGATVGTIVDSGIGSQKNFGAFLNGYFDFGGKDSAFQPYVGGGIGLQSAKFDYRPSNVDVGQASKTNLAWQLMAGASYKVSPSFELFGQYNYRDAGKTKIDLDLLPADLKAKSRQSVFSLGLRIPFGGE